GRGVYCFRCGFHRSRVVPALVQELVGEEYTAEFEPRYRHFNDSAEWYLRFARPATQFKIATKYLKERGLNSDEIDRLGILYSPSGDFEKRVIFTIRRNEDGPVVFFTGRSIRQAIKPKYKNAPIPKNGFFYNVGTGDRGIVCEGPFDAIKAAQAGYRGIAIFGKSLSAAQARGIGSIINHATVILDEDAFNKSIDVSVALSYYVPTERKDTPPGKDLGDLTTATIRGIMEQGGGILKQITGEDSGPIFRGFKTI
ncbi:MAG: hypothetical protein ACE5H1_07820, partial [Thermodesulfobacteriota bacterium]